MKTHAGISDCKPKMTEKCTFLTAQKGLAALLKHKGLWELEWGCHGLSIFVYCRKGAFKP